MKKILSSILISFILPLFVSANTLTGTTTIDALKLSNLSNTFLSVNSNGDVVATTTPTGGSSLLDLITNGYKLFSTPIVQSSKLIVFGDSIAMGYNSTDRPNKGYGGLIASDMGATQTNRAVSGSGSCDANGEQIFPNENPSSTSSPVYILQTGDNDGFYKGLSYESTYKLCAYASLSWLSIPSQSKVFGQSVSTTGTWSADNTYVSGIAIKSTTNASTATFPIKTYGNKIYLWYRIMDGNGGTFTYSVDGGSAVSVTNYTSPSISTGIGGSSGVGVVRIPVSAGTHSVVVTVTSGTSGGNIVSILGVGTPALLQAYRAPKVFVGGVPERQSENVPVYNTAAFDQFNKDIVTTMQGENLPVYFVDIRNAITTSTDDLQDVVHPSDLGHSKIRDVFEGVMQFTPRLSGSIDLSNYITFSYASSTFGSGGTGLGTTSVTAGYVPFASSTITTTSGTSTITTPITYYKLDSGALTTDSVGSNTLTNTGSVSEGTAKLGSASASFDGGNRQLTVSSAVGFTSSGAMTWNMWVKQSSLGGYQFDVITNSGAQKRVTLYTDSSKFQVYLWGTNIDSGMTLSTNTWYMVTITYNNGAVELFVNGVSKGTATAGSSAGNANALSIGTGYLNNSGERMNGLVDDIYIEDSVISGAEITALYNSGTGTQYPYSGGSSSTSTITSLINSNIFISDSKIGIGTTTPQSTLSVLGTTTMRGFNFFDGTFCHYMVFSSAVAEPVWATSTVCN